MNYPDTLLARQAACGSYCKSGQTLSAPANTSVTDQIKTFVTHLFDTGDWPARWHCGSWSDFHGWLYILSDLLIWASYFAIPVMLFILVKKKRDIPFPKIIWLFCAFIILCGITHFMDAAIFWWPAYRLSALFRLLTGLVSLITVIALYKIIPQVHSLRTVAELEKEIAERQAIAERLAASEFLLSEAGRMGKVGGWEIKVDQQEMLWSKTIYDIYELPYDYTISTDDAYNYYTADSLKIFRKAMDECLATGKSFDLELQLITAKKKVLWVRCYGEALYNDERVLIKIRGLLMDIDQYKTNEMSLNKSIELVSQHNKQLKVFNHILSHNIRNHTSNLSLIASLIDESTLDEDNLELFENIKKVSEGLNTTLEDLSEAIKIREAVLATEDLNFEEVFRHVMHIIDPIAKSNQAVIIHDFQVKNINFPRVYLESILMNLLTNAIKYKRENVDPVINLKTYVANERVVLECIDNGVGIDLALHASKMFGLYKTFHDRKDAHGVGLFLIKTQIESQGGEIVVESTPDVGSVFKIIF